MKYNIQQLAIQANAAKILIENMAALLGQDDELIADTVEGETELIEVIDQAIKRVLFVEGLIDQIAAEQAKLADRKKRLVNQVAMIKTAVGAAMEDGSLKKVEGASYTISSKAVPDRAIVLEEADLPSEYFKKTVTVDKSKLLKALKEGLDISGATLSNGGRTIQIRRG